MRVSWAEVFSGCVNGSVGKRVSGRAEGGLRASIVRFFAL